MIVSSSFRPDNPVDREELRILKLFGPNNLLTNQFILNMNIIVVHRSLENVPDISKHVNHVKCFTLKATLHSHGLSSAVCTYRINVSIKLDELIQRAFLAVFGQSPSPF